MNRCQKCKAHYSPLTDTLEDFLRANIDGDDVEIKSDNLGLSIHYSGSGQTAMVFMPSMHITFASKSPIDFDALRGAEEELLRCVEMFKVRDQCANGGEV